MLSIRSIVGTNAQWTPDEALRRDYTLVSNGQKVATLQFTPARTLNARAESADGCWILERAGALQPRLTLRTCGSGEPVGVFTCTTWNTAGTLVLGGHHFLFSTNYWRTRMAFSDRSNTKLVTFKTSGWFNIGARVDVTPAGAVTPELPLLTLVGWYQATIIHMGKHLLAALSESGR